MGFKEKVKAVADKGQQVAAQAKAVQGQKSQQKTQRAQATVSAQQARGILFQGKSHEEGRNARVMLYEDRIERVKEKSLAALSNARQDTEVTPLRTVASVQAKKDGVLFTKVTVYASGNNIEFRFRHEEAAQFKKAITTKLLEKPDVNPPTAAAPQPNELDQLKKLGELRDSGLLTEDEFQTKKKQLLGL